MRATSILVIGCLSLLFATLRSARSEELTEEQLQLLKTFHDEFIAITPGEGQFPKSFTMGGRLEDEQPRHEVTFDYQFRIAKYEVPQNLWRAVMGNNPSRWKGERNSVEMLTFAQAEEFCRRATEMMRQAKLIEAPQHIRLPTEAEWEYVARAGTSTAYSFGDDVSKLSDYAWFTGNAAGNDPPVGAKKPNPWGLYDIHGYLSEWCADVAHENYEGAPGDGSAWLNGGDEQRRVIRSGSWKDPADKLRSASRFFAPATLTDDAVGLRCVLQ